MLDRPELQRPRSPTSTSLRKGERREVGAARLHHERDRIAASRCRAALLDQPGVHRAVEPLVEDGVVDVPVGVIVGPAGRELPPDLELGPSAPALRGSPGGLVEPLRIALGDLARIVHQQPRLPHRFLREQRRFVEGDAVIAQPKREAAALAQARRAARSAARRAPGCPAPAQSGSTISASSA